MRSKNLQIDFKQKIQSSILSLNMIYKSKLFSIALCAVILFSCSTTANFQRDKNLFEASKVITKYKAVADMNDAYFVIKENNFFEFYRELFDSLKNTSYPGRYTKSGDTLFLKFYNKNGNKLLSNKALLNSEKKEIIFFDTYTGVKKKLIFN